MKGGQPFGHLGQVGFFEDTNTALHDLVKDPVQINPIQDDKVEGRLINILRSLMVENEAPPEAFGRLKI